MPRKLIQTKLKFFTYTKHSKKAEKSCEQEYQEKKQAHLEQIRNMLNYKPKKLRAEPEPEPESEKEEKPVEAKPWGNMPEMYPGQHEGKPFLPYEKKEEKK